MKNRSYRITWIMMALISLVFLGWSAKFISDSSFIAFDGQRYYSLRDDAMISMRYAWNLSHGKGLVWNEGVYVEGYTNTLMTLYMTLPTALFDKSNAVLFIEISGIVFMFIIAILAKLLTQEVFRQSHLPQGGFFGVLLFAMTLLYYPLLFWTLLGMETGMLTIMVLLATLLVLRVDNNRKSQPVFATVLGLAFMIRPDALIFICVLYLYRALGLVAKKRWRALFLEMVVVSIFIFGLSIFRLIYYHSLVPNTYTLKMAGIPLEVRIRNGLFFILPFVYYLAVPAIFAVFYTLFQRRKHLILLIMLFMVTIVYQVYVGGDVWSYWRILCPVVPLFFILCVENMWHIICKLTSYLPVSKWPPLRAIGLLLVTAFSLIIFYWANYQFLPELTLQIPHYETSNDHEHTTIGLILNKITTPTATIAVFWAGSAVYYADRSAIDMLGKSDLYISSLAPDLSGPRWERMTTVPGHNKYDLSYSIIKLQPTFAEGLSWLKQDVEATAKNYKEYLVYNEPMWLNTDSEDVSWDSPAFRRVRIPGLNDPIIGYCLNKGGIDFWITRNGRRKQVFTVSRAQLDNASRQIQRVKVNVIVAQIDNWEIVRIVKGQFQFRNLKAQESYTIDLTSCANPR